MCTRITRLLAIAGSLLALAGPVIGQEVNSDVKIPPPSELVAGGPAISGPIGTNALFTSDGQAFGGAVAEAALGRLSEGETRDAIGNFMTSLLVRAGIVDFENPPAALTSSAEKRQDGARPAWIGPTPTTFSVSAARRAASARRR